jgi:hypothetical protein
MTLVRLPGASQYLDSIRKFKDVVRGVQKWVIHPPKKYGGSGGERGGTWKNSQQKPAGWKFEGLLLCRTERAEWSAHLKEPRQEELH